MIYDFMEHRKSKYYVIECKSMVVVDVELLMESRSWNQTLGIW
jgi:hypothetical protein